MAREITVYRRRTRLVDMLFNPLPYPQVGADTYRVQAASNFDSAYTTLVEVTRSGYVDPGLTPTARASLVTLNNPNQIRVTFDPVTYSLADASPIWFRLVPVIGGVAGTPGPGHLSMPYEAGYRQELVVLGDVPAGAALANSLELHLPYTGTGMVVKNTGANPLALAFSASGPEVTLAVNEVRSFGFGTTGLVFVRGAGGASRLEMAIHPPYGL